MSGYSCFEREHSFLSSFLKDPLTMSGPIPRDEIRWFPMYVSYRRELTVKQALDGEHIENYIPMKQVLERKDKQIVRSMEPIIHNMIFVYSCINTLSHLKMFCPDCAPMQYMTFKARTLEQSTTIITVEEARMRQFMKAMEIPDDQNRRTLLPYDEALYGKEGRRIRFIRGDFEGIEGTIKRVNKNRSLIITLKHVGVLVITIDHAADIEFLD